MSFCGISYFFCFNSFFLDQDRSLPDNCSCRFFSVNFCVRFLPCCWPIFQLSANGFESFQVSSFLFLHFHAFNLHRLIHISFSDCFYVNCIRRVERDKRVIFYFFIYFWQNSSPMPV